MKRLLLLGLLLIPLLLTGCTMDQIMSGMVNQPPQAVIDATPVSGTAPLTVTFDAHYSHDDGTIASYHWDFGDPHDSAPLDAEKGTHTYQYPGTYLVKLTVIDAEGSFDSQEIAIEVTNAPPIANFSATDDAPTVGDTVEFDASGSYDPNGEVVSYEWDFGDGTTGEGVKVSHSYANTGYYVITLTVTDDAGAVGTARHAVNVQEKSSGGGCSGGSCGGPDIPLAVITGLPGCSGGEVGVPIEFDGSYSRAAEGKIVSYKWDFGDGTTGSGVRVSHAYQKTGRFLVTLTVTDENGTKGTAVGAVSIGSSSCY
ncbi:PKD domain-containing protein [Candidatus Bipolaricaulota bacterium]|nr:PKD domain-containing protein [Candidatus Bipolaricaulota bacterium]